MKTKLSYLALAALLFLGLSLQPSSGAVAVSVGIAPPAIPIYEQPFCPGPGYVWVPGYWAYGPYGYYWVPGAWVLPPGVGFLWTPGYWAYRGGNYLFIDGYWGTSVGYYGGINYGYGYFGSGYYGGRWSGNTFLYNTAVTRVGPSIKTVYVNRDALKFKGGNRAGFNGPGGVQAKPTDRERAAEKGKRIKPTETQRTLAQKAAKDPALRAKENKGKPKPEAVRAARSEIRNGAGATNRKPEAAEKKGDRREGARRTEAETAKRADVDRRNKAEKPDRPTAESVSKPKREVKTGRSPQGSREAARKVEPVRRQVEPRKARSAPREVRRAPAAPRKVQALKGRKAPAPARGGNAPAQGEEKKKKRNKDKPGGR
jgi:hypothetical protein